MQCYRISTLGSFYDYEFVTYDNITAKELKKWFKKNYAHWRFVKVKQIDISEIDPIWAIELEKCDDIIKFV